MVLFPVHPMQANSQLVPALAAANLDQSVNRKRNNYRYIVHEPKHLALRKRGIVYS